MPISDRKKCQTLLNLCALAAQDLESIAAQLETYRSLYQAAGIDPTGTPLDGNVTAVSNWINSIRACADDPVTAGLINAYVPTHQNNALDQER